jgi:hypothetical protein
LKNAALKCDEESERIAEQFLAGDMDCDKFLQVYVKSRTVSFMIKIFIIWIFNQLSRKIY